MSGWTTSQMVAACGRVEPDVDVFDVPGLSIDTQIRLHGPYSLVIIMAYAQLYFLRCTGAHNAVALQGHERLGQCSP